jgi:hypothetical protein
MDGSGLLDRTMIPDFPIPDSGFPNSEFRMAYGESGIPHHETLDPRGAPGQGPGRIRGREPGGVGHGMSNTNSGVGHSMTEGGTWLPSVKSGSETMGEGRRGSMAYC